MIFVQIQHLSNQCTVIMSSHYTTVRFSHFYNFLRHDDPVGWKHVEVVKMLTFYKCYNVKTLKQCIGSTSVVFESFLVFLYSVLLHSSHVIHTHGPVQVFRYQVFYCLKSLLSKHKINYDSVTGLYKYYSLLAYNVFYFSIQISYYKAPYHVTS
jgi:hypothetical protein